MVRQRIVSTLLGMAAALVLIAGGTAMARPADLATQDDCFQCWAGTEVGCESDEHRDFDRSDNAYFRDGDIHPCIPSDPDEYCAVHNTCIESQVAGALDLQQMQRMSPEALRELVARQQDVTFNASRGAAQVTGCGGSVIAHVPLTRAQIAALTD